MELSIFLLIALLMGKVMVQLMLINQLCHLPCVIHVNDVAVGSHPLVTRLLKGVYNLRTPSPHYLSTWHVIKITSYPRTLFPLDQLSLKSLHFITVMLCALSSAIREHTLCALDIKFLKKFK